MILDSMVEIVIFCCPRKIEDLWFVVLNHKSELFEKRENNAITIK